MPKIRIDYGTFRAFVLHINHERWAELQAAEKEMIIRAQWAELKRNIGEQRLLREVFYGDVGQHSKKKLY
jgi:lipopolysaccharide biosynthesis glycosyltransferase